ncbi:O-antigen ligase domain-containing protein [Enterobacter sp. WCHEn045836]|uniref:O-antigen ligase family protein n=1 Tax=Enterobacter sp. WCHEn045836 TaxID=2497434 RepID=UPI000F827091|nr:O-antigen ligase family protein [Enterobacter sp. WCHEn045836]RTP97296.1 O-antigen ligase domain-containing protein [Enterobacter sp. WCHEn045836]
MAVAVAVLFIVLAIYLPGNGGAGVTLPWNLTFTAWTGMMLIVLACRYKSTSARGESQPLITLGGILLLLPWLLQARGNPGVWTLLAALLLWQLLMRIPLTTVRRQQILWAVFILALGQAGIGLLQTFSPSIAARLYEFNWLRNHGRPYGIFQQVNLMASFLAIGIACGFLLLMKSGSRAARLIVPGLGLLAFVMALNQSRAGAMGAVISVIAISWLVGRNHPLRMWAGVMIMILAACAGVHITQHITVLVNGQPSLIARDYTGSTRERLYILEITWKMIQAHPWTGYGYGTFEYAFSRYVLTHPETGYSYSSIVNHPHNELLYAWFQGGVIALAGMLALCVGWLVILIRAARQSHYDLAQSLLILPLLVHINLEYPLYQSFVHFGLLLILLRLGVADIPSPASTVQVLPLRQRAICALCGTAMFIFSLTGLYAGQKLTALERSGLVNFPVPAPWYFTTQSERAQFDGMVALLTDYNLTRNSANLDAFMVQAEKWSERYNDKNVWRSMITIAQHRNETEKLAEMKEMYRQLFPQKTEQQPSIPPEH